MELTNGAAKDETLLLKRVMIPLRLSEISGSSAIGLSLKEPVDNSWLFPVENGIITSGFGSRTSPISGSGEVHNGIDIAVPEGTEVKAVTGGTIVYSGTSPSYGIFIRERTDDGYTALYAHLSESKVSQGERVEKGSSIALSGQTGWATGPHLHLTAEKDGAAFDPLTMYKGL